MSKPNYIIFLTDDQGYGDLSCMGSKDFFTPNIDMLAEKGVRFTNWYSNSPVCSPSRASLLTGRYSGNAGVRAILDGHRTATGLPPKTPTIAKALKDEGYQTYMAGKWHLGMSEECTPNNHGFDHWYGFKAGCIDYYSHIFYWGMNNPGPGINPTHDLWEDDKEIWNNGEYFTESITNKALEYIRKTAESSEPFFLYVPFNAPHYPMHAPKKYMERFSHLPWDRQVMAAMLSAVDDGIGKIMAELETQGLENNTCTFFTSDNGPSRESRNWLDGNLDCYYGGTTGGLKGHKFSLFEGGIKVPGIIHWPEKLPAGKTVDAPFASMDIFPTFLNAASGKLDDYEIDGTDIIPYLQNDKLECQRDLYWEMQDQTAVRRGDWKLVINGQTVEEESCGNPLHLTNIVNDFSEKINLANDNPELCAELKESAEKWRKKIEKRWAEEYSNCKCGSVTHK